MPQGYRIEEGQGVGLRNVGERLQKLYGRGNLLEIRDNVPRGTVAVVRIPVGG